MSDIKNFERNNYFYGKLMTVRDFETEQRYFIEKQRLINRLIHGAGVVCGLKVEEVAGDTTKIKIKPGVAIDCCGRDIIVPEEKVVDLKDEYRLEDHEKTVYVLLKYDFCEKESVPVITNASACEETCCCNRILETYKIEISEEPPEDCVPSDDGLCDVWPNLSRVSAKTGPIHFERFMPKLAKKGEVFKVTVKVKAKEDLFSFKIEDTLPSDLELYEGSSSLEREDIKKGETIYHTYWVKAKKIGGFGIKGEIDWKKIIGGLASINPLPGSLLETTETPDEEKAKSFVDYWIEGCPECPEDPAVVLAAITLQKRDSSFEIKKIDNAIINEEGFEKSFVFSNPRLYELIKCVEKKAGLEKDLTCITGISWEHDREYVLSDEGDMADLLNVMQRCTITFNGDIKKETINLKTLNGFLLGYTVFEDPPVCAYLELIWEKSNLPVCFFPEEEEEEEAKDRVSFTLWPGITDFGPVVYWAFYNMIKTRTQTAYNLRVTMGLTTEPQPEVTGEEPQPEVIGKKNCGIRFLIQLKGDFVLDDDGNPVDANHLKGERPTGNGTPGGLFESWFDLKFDCSIVYNARKVISNEPGRTTEEVATSASLSSETAYFILEAMAKNNLIYHKEGKYYPLPDPAKTMIVYDAQLTYMWRFAKELKDNLGDEGIIAKIKSSDKFTDDDKKNYEIILLRGEAITETTKVKMGDVESKLDWSKDTGDIKIVKSPYIEDTNVFIVGGKNKKAVDAAVDEFLKNYTITERTG